MCFGALTIWRNFQNKFSIWGTNIKLLNFILGRTRSFNIQRGDQISYTKQVQLNWVFSASGKTSVTHWAAPAWAQQEHQSSSPSWKITTFSSTIILLAVFPLTQEISMNVVNLPFYGLGFLQVLFPPFSGEGRERKRMWMAGNRRTVNYYLCPFSRAIDLILYLWLQCFNTHTHTWENTQAQDNL